MEGVGARFGRSSSRYGGSAAVFTGPVRKWKKKWVHVAPSGSNSNHHRHAAVNGSNGSSRLLLYKWTPITPNGNNGNDDDGVNGKVDSKMSDKDDKIASEGRPRKKFKHIPIIVLEEQNQVSSEQDDDEAKPNDSEVRAMETTQENDENQDDEKPDINDTPVDENQGSENKPPERQDLNEATLDLSLGLKAHDGETE